jgi:hypothetical protein
MIPRIRGKVGQCSEDEERPENVGKWFFEIWISELGSGEMKDSESLGLFGPWDTKERAHKELTEATQLVSRTIAERLPGGMPGFYIDMKDNKKKKWKK